MKKKWPLIYGKKFRIYKYSQKKIESAISMFYEFQKKSDFEEYFKEMRFKMKKKWSMRLIFGLVL